jgi:hypothetical protein
MKQTTFASLAWSGKGKVTRRERFLAEMDQVIPWQALRDLIEPHYPKAGNGTQPMRSTISYTFPLAGTVSMIALVSRLMISICSR